MTLLPDPWVRVGATALRYGWCGSRKLVAVEPLFGGAR